MPLDNPEIIELLKRLFSIIWRLVIILYIANMLKGLVRGIVIKCWLFFNKTILVDKWISVDGIEGCIKEIKFWETKIEVTKGSKKYHFFIPNDKLLHSTKGFKKE